MTLCSRILLVLSLLPTVGNADALECDLHPNTFNKAIEPNVPHVQVKADLNGDGVEDFFYLAGKNDQVATCIFFGSKTKEGYQLKLEQREGRFFLPIGDFSGGGKPQILQPEPFEECGLDNGVQYIPAKLNLEIEKAYKRWTKNYKGFAHRYRRNNAENNLYLLNPAHIYQYDGAKKVDVTEQSKAYLDLKEKVLTATIEQKDVPSKCGKALQYLLKRLHQYGEKWVPVAVGIPTDQCVKQTGFQLGPTPMDYISFSDDCSKPYVRKGKPTLNIESVTVTGMLGFAGVCTEKVTSEIKMTFDDGTTEIISALQALNPGRRITMDPHSDGLTLSYSIDTPGYDLLFKEKKTATSHTGPKRSQIQFSGHTPATLDLASTVTCPRLDLLQAFKTDPAAAARIRDKVLQDLSIMMEF
jgi:hypothetical protein